MRATVGRFISRGGYLLSIPFLALAALGIIVDLRWLVVAWMLPCVVLPMLMLLAYYHVMLSPGVRILSFPRRAIYIPGESLTLVPLHCSDEDTRPLPSPVSVSDADIETIECTSSRILFTVKATSSSPLRFIHVPLDALCRE